LTIIIYVRNISGLATKEASHPSMMETRRATTSAVPPTADIVGHRGHVRKVPKPEVAASFDHLRGRFGKISSSTWNDSPAPAFVLATHPRPQKESSGVELQDICRSSGFDFYSRLLGRIGTDAEDG
jgi:hypothetical protein